MDKVYNFDWIIDDIDESLIFMLRDGSGMQGSYHADSLKYNGIDEVEVRFANINDLTNFINYTGVRFINSQNKNNFIDIPLNKIFTLYNRIKVKDGIPQAINLTDLNSFAIVNEKIASDGYTIIPFKIREPNEELTNVTSIIANFENLSMNDKIDALEDINLINYHKSKDTTSKRR